MRLSSLIMVFASLGLAACGAPDPMTDDITLDDSKADSTAELRVRVADTTVWADTYLVRDGASLRLNVRSSRNVTGGLPFTGDDPYGQLALVGPRSFSVSWQESEAAGLVTGVNQLVRIDFAHSASRPDSLAARVNVRPRWTQPKGIGGSLASEILPVLANGVVVFRLSGTASKQLYQATPSVGRATVIDEGHFRVDLTAAELLALAATGRELTIELREVDGSHVKRGQIALMVKRFGLTAADPTTVWPPPACTNAARTCIASLPPDAVDYGACGEALVVQACLAGVGSRVGAGEIAAALKQLDTQLADPAGFAGDVSGLVGADVAADFTTRVRAAVAARISALEGRVYATADARAAAIAAELDAGMVAAYARPFDYIARHAPLPNDVARARQVAADETLVWLASHDLRLTEWGRPLEELVHDYRARHVASIRALRETSESIAQGADDIYLGDYLGAGTHIEVTIERATGVVTNMLFEID
jgi:hypothetical protein